MVEGHIIGKLDTSLKGSSRTVWNKEKELCLGPTETNMKGKWTMENKLAKECTFGPTAIGNKQNTWTGTPKERASSITQTGRLKNESMRREWWWPDSFINTDINHIMKKMNFDDEIQININIDLQNWFYVGYLFSSSFFSKHLFFTHFCFAITNNIYLNISKQISSKIYSLTSYNRLFSYQSIYHKHKANFRSIKCSHFGHTIILSLHDDTKKGTKKNMTVDSNRKNTHDHPTQPIISFFNTSPE